MKASAALIAAVMLMGSVRAGAAQFSDPCGAGCALTLGAVSGIFATGASAAVGRMTGGFTTVHQAGLTWGVSALTAVGAGIALSDDGEVQRSAVLASAVGAGAGAVVGLVARSVIGESTGAQRLAATLIGAAVGVVVGGTLGALDPGRAVADGTPTLAVVPAQIQPSFSISLPVGFP